MKPWLSIYHNQWTLFLPCILCAITCQYYQSNKVIHLKSTAISNTFLLSLYIMMFHYFITRMHFLGLDNKSCPSRIITTELFHVGLRNRSISLSATLNLAIKVCWCPQLLLKLQVAHPLLDKTCIKHIACKLSGNAITFPHTISTSYTGWTE